LSLEVRADVREALQRGAPVVALESTLISHGLPHPQNLEVAREAERTVRSEGAVPATIGLVAGRAKVGLDEAELELMATAEGIPKLSARDLPVAVAKNSHGATTVAATAHLAALAGIRLLATGGLGGVHRGASESWDVSADLAALAGTPVAVLCSGVKSILDVPATLEYLETLGVPVVGFRTLRFPGFYLSDSGSPLDWSVESEREAARVIRGLPTLGLENSGLVFANPLPQEEQLDPDLHERALRMSLKELERRGIRGRDVTPFLLDRFVAETKGESLRVNRRIILGNVRLAARIARALSTLDGSS
jgi:pseudouridine-5'-phosphate glycosidase